jgi:D-amino-acid oxidase
MSCVEYHDLPLEETGMLREGQKEVWFKHVVHDVLILSSYIDVQFHEIPSEKLPPGVKAGMSLTTVSINTQIYLPYLQSRLLSLGATFIRRHLSHIREAFKLISPPAAIVVNATGVLASKLGGVEDQAVYPTRGQTILVRNECSKMYFRSGERLGLEPTYIIPRRFGGGTILGGCRQPGNWYFNFKDFLIIY